MITCSKCQEEHDGYGIPPSYKGKINLCYKCYRALKNKVSKAWFAKNPGQKRLYNKKSLAKLTPREKADKWKDRTRRWKAGQLAIKIAKAKRNSRRLLPTTTIHGKSE